MPSLLPRILREEFCTTAPQPSPVGAEGCAATDGVSPIGATETDDCVVQLRCAPLPLVLRHFALHHWFTRSAPTEAGWERWEVWQSQNRGGTSWGHVHRDLMAPHSGVGGGPGWVAAEWRGDEARRIAAVLERCSTDYPYPRRYLAWPGPNSNTFIAWVLREAGIADDMDPRGIGKDFLGAWGVGGSARPAELRIESPVLGLRVRRGVGVELHLFGLTIGVGVNPFTLQTPFGSCRPGRRGSREFGG
jgi:hypothetical protein